MVFVEAGYAIARQILFEINVIVFDKLGVLRVLHINMNESDFVWKSLCKNKKIIKIASTTKEESNFYNGKISSLKKSSLSILKKLLMQS